MQIERASRSLSVAILLTLSGGFLDAFAYVGHGHVFANSMTGNVALLGVSLAAGAWAQALRHVPPLIAFAIAVFVWHLLGLASASRWLKQPAMTCLGLEVAFLVVAASGLIDIPDFWLIPGISFVATLQTMSFTHLENLSYTSVMTTGNLRRCVQGVYAGFIPRYDPSALHDARLLGTISLSFLLGAVIGGLSTSRLHDSALWVAVALLAGAFLQIMRIARARKAE